MRKIQHASIKVQIPNEALTDGGLFQQGGYLLMLQSLSQDNQYLDVIDGEEYNIAKINTIKPEFVQAILSKDIEEGYRIDMMNENSRQTPYLHVLKTELNKVFKDDILLKDYANISVVEDVEDSKKVYVVIGHFPDGKFRLGCTSYEELLEMAVKYGIDKIEIINTIINEEL